ncbi:protein FRIGIDA [Ricinus communis]|uniref:protein FRIGIDA n=1 Tax=Ricinus communis TaxID=3988 RepID=UPI00201A450B|nr:protein FRIGIDA [Ricinus communis]
MATPPLFSVKQEPDHQSPLPLIPLPQPYVKGEPVEELPIVTIQQQEPQFLQSIEELNTLSSAINEFYRRFSELQNHLDFIHTSIKQHEEQQQIQDAPTPTITTPTIVTDNQTTITDAKKETVINSAPPPAKSSSSSELISLCEMMCGRGLRKYLTSNLTNIPKLRNEVPTALKYAPKPAKLVFDCFGGFYLQGSRAYTKDSPMVPGRKASILVLELFLLILDDGIQFDSDLRQEAQQAAAAWRKRLIAEGGVSKACEIDARGLLLFVGCFGIPKVFTSGDIWDLIRSSNLQQISDALKRSHVLVTKVSDILERMMNNGMKIEAIDVAYTFGIEDKFPPQKLLTSFLRDSKEALKRRRREANNSPVLLKEASQKHLSTLKSAMKFLEGRKLDPKKLLPGWQVTEKIDKLEKEIADLNRKIDDKVAPKRKADENEFSINLKSQEVKRLRFTGSPLISSPSFGLHEQRVPSHLDGNGSYNASTRINMVDGGFSCLISNPPVAGSMLYGSGSYSAAYGVPSTSSFAGVYRETLADRTGNITGSNVSAFGWHGVGDASIIDGTRGQSLVHQSGSGLFGPSIEGFAGLPNSSPPGAANQSSASDLYRFADAVK